MYYKIPERQWISMESNRQHGPNPKDKYPIKGNCVVQFIKIQLLDQTLLWVNTRITMQEMVKPLRIKCYITTNSSVTDLSLANFVQ